MSDKSADKRGGNFGWGAAGHPYDYPDLTQQGVPQDVGFEPHPAWNLDNRGMEYDGDDMRGISPSMAVYLTEDLLAKYVEHQEKLKQRKRLMNEAFGLH